MVTDDINVCIQYERLNIEIITNKILIYNINVFIRLSHHYRILYLLFCFYLMFYSIKSENNPKKCEIVNRVLQVKSSLELYLLFLKCRL